MTEWKTIDTAPKDHIGYLLLCQVSPYGDTTVYTGEYLEYTGQVWVGQCAGYRVYDAKPTHWMYLPEVPEFPKEVHAKVFHGSLILEKDE